MKIDRLAKMATVLKSHCGGNAVGRIAYYGIHRSLVGVIGAGALTLSFIITWVDTELVYGC